MSLPPTRRTWIVGLLVLAACTDQPQEIPVGPTDPLDRAAEGYVKLVLAVGRHDADYVDAYYGPADWREPSASAPLALDTILARARALLETVEASAGGDGDEMVELRRRYLATQLRSLVARVEMLGGARSTFDEESRALYDAVAPAHDERHYERLLSELAPLLPGQGEVAARFAAFRERFVIPGHRLDAVFRAAIDECRARTQARLKLPPGESFSVEYVQGKSWSAYNWYQGGFRSLIQVNIDLPISIDRAIDLACHEGYPGHHVYNALLEQQLVRDRGWVEFSVYPLFSPQSLIAEGTANYGILVAFPGDERVEFEARVLFPLAGLDPREAEAYYRVLGQVERLSYAGNEAARRYLDGAIDAGAAADWLVRYALMTPERAAQRVRFIDQYRSYVINYNLGQDLVRSYVERKVGGEADVARVWEEFGKLLASPRLPSGL